MDGEDHNTLDAELRYMRQVASPQLFLIDMVVDVDRLSPGITPELLDELTGHSGPA